MSGTQDQIKAYPDLVAEHGRSGAFWQPRPCYAPAPDAVWRAAESLSLAADAVLANDLDEATTRLGEAERADLLDWAIPIMSFQRPEVVRWRPRLAEAPLSGPVGKRAPDQPMLDAMYRRDGWRCRFCGCPVVRPEARKRICIALPEAVRWSGVYGDHAGFYVMSAVADHVVPYSLGGLTILGNLVTCCQPCNYGRGNALVADHGLIDPRTRDPFPATGWDGLQRLMVLQDKRLSSVPLPMPHINTVVWRHWTDKALRKKASLAGC